MLLRTSPIEHIAATQALGMELGSAHAPVLALDSGRSRSTVGRLRRRNWSPSNHSRCVLCETDTGDLRISVAMALNR